MWSLAGSEEPGRDESTDIANTDYETTTDGFLEGARQIDQG
jgi:hypothetical protein